MQELVKALEEIKNFHVKMRTEGAMSWAYYLGCVEKITDKALAAHKAKSGSGGAYPFEATGSGAGGVYHDGNSLTLKEYKVASSRPKQPKEHKAKPTKEDVENWINEDIKVQFEEPPIKKPALSEDELVDIIHKTVQRRVPFESVIPSIIKALRDAGVLNVRESNPLVIQYKTVTHKGIEMKSDTNTIISALRILAVDIKSDDGVANACISEAADRLEELQAKLDNIEKQGE